MLQPRENANGPIRGRAEGAKQTSGRKSEHTPSVSKVQLLPPNVAALEVMADWKERLEARIRVALLKQELLDADLDFSDLQSEVAEFKRACRLLTWRDAA